MSSTTALGQQAIATLKGNDYGDYIVPTQNLYPFQWNWDSAVHALALHAIGDEKRAWLELETLLASVWDNGLLPHIIFHKPSPTYFPGPDEWQTDRTPRTSAISQPPLVCYAALHIYQNATDKALALTKLRQLYPALLAHTRWWYAARFDERTNLIFTVHPWETGRDNNPVYDAPLKAVPAVAREYERRDISIVDTAERPHKFEYDRYMYLVDFYKRTNFDTATIARDCPYKVCDAGLSAILARATDAVLQIADIVSADRPADLAANLERLKKGFATLWSDELQIYCGYDLIADQLIKVPAAHNFFALFGKIPTDTFAAKMDAEINRWLAMTKFGVAGVAPDSPLYEPRRYCRGPVWPIVNWLIATGLSEYGFTATADKLKQSSLTLTTQKGFAEYYDPHDGKPCGGTTFSWTAALALHWLKLPFAE